MKKVSSGTSATSVAASADGADISPQYANAYETPKFTRPNTITPGSAAPCGSVMRRTRARMKRSTAAIAKRSPAPKNGGNSRLLKRTATKFDPPMSTTATNAVALVPGALLLLLLAALSGERWATPTRPEVWAAFLYLATVGTLALFIGVVYVVQRWTASASSYVTVLFPVVTVSLGAILAGELVSLQFVVGAAMVMAGTYVGAIAR